MKMRHCARISFNSNMAETGERLGWWSKEVSSSHGSKHYDISFRMALVAFKIKNGSALKGLKNPFLYWCDI